MNLTEQAHRAYAPSQMPIQTPRSVEARLFSQVTSRLSKAAHSSADYPTLVAALHDNRRMWTTLATDVVGDDNGLPPALRAQIFYLAEFTEKHSQMVLRGAANCAALIEINTAIMRGLNSQETA